MTAREYLRQLRCLDTVINQKVEEVNALRARSRSAGGVDYSKEKAQTSAMGEASFVNPVLRVIALEQEINEEIDRFVEQKHKIINQIQALNSADYINVLYKRYVEFKSLERICVEMHFSYAYVKHLHIRALRTFENKNLKSAPNNT